MLIPRTEFLHGVSKLLRERQVVAVLGARQVGKTTLARQVLTHWKTSHWFDCEDPRDLARLMDPMRTLGGLTGLVVIDEVQRRPDLFPALRALADRRPTRARFLLLGSASGELLKQSSESLAGRIAYSELTGLRATEVGPAQTHKLWLRGGFPPSFTAGSTDASFDWRRDFVRTFLERDIPQLGIRIPSRTIDRFWSMLAHVHGQLLNWSELGRSMGVTDHTVRAYCDVLEDTFMVRQLRPWHENIGKRLVKAPKLYFRDSGLLHTFLDVRTQSQLDRHPKVGASFEGFFIEELISMLALRREECFFWRTQAGAELDLLVVRGGRKFGFEIKYTDTPAVTPSMRHAVADLGLDRLAVIHSGGETYELAEKITAVSMDLVWRDATLSSKTKARRRSAQSNTPRPHGTPRKH